MRLNVSLGSIAIAVAAVLPGCASNEGGLMTSGVVAVPLAAAQTHGTITVELANLVAFTLPPATPGWAWQIAQHDTRYLALRPGFRPANPPDEGSVVEFVAVKTGTTRLRFVLLPEAPQRSVEPAAQQEVSVTIR